jgi:NAD(P)-dependent dehydrogenase (short-subunit alcohol dehydrogenase family)
MSPDPDTVPCTATLVTGCSSGIGRATARALHGAGFVVYATARTEGPLEQLAAEGMVPLVLDVTDEASRQAAVDRVVADHGAVGVLVNNAGYSQSGALEQTSMDDLRRQFETNVFGLVRLIQLVLPGMRRQGWGRVVNIGSMGGRFSFPGGGAYHATKHAVEAVSDALRLEVAPFGVGVSLVQPGPVTSSFGDTAIAGMDVGDGPYAQFHHEVATRYASTYGGRGSDLSVTPEAVARVVLRAVSDRHPRARYAVGTLSRLLMTTRRVLPDQAWDAFMRSSWPTPRGP